MGIIDTVSAGFGMVNRRLWFIVVPVLLDFLLWIGPKFAVAPWLSNTLEWYYQSLSQASVQLPADQLEALRVQGSQVLEVLGNVNLFGVLAWQLPGIIGTDISDVASLTGSIQLYNLEDGQTIVALFSALVILSLGIACLYLGAIAQFVRSDTSSPWHFLRRLGANWLNLLSFFVLMALGIVFLGMPLILMSALGALINPLLGRILGGLLLALILWLWIYLFFAVNGILVSEANAVTAMGHSITVVKRNFWSSLRFIGLMVLIQLGLPLAWNLVLHYSVAVPLVIVGNAYVATGLQAANMIFYRDRLTQWQRNNLSVWGRDIS